MVSKRRTCGQCGESYAMSACGPTHALVAAERCHLYPALLAERDELIARANELPGLTAALDEAQLERDELWEALEPLSKLVCQRLSRRRRQPCTAPTDDPCAVCRARILLSRHPAQPATPAVVPLPPGEVRFNGGVACDVASGPCACGATHPAQPVKGTP